MLKIFKRQKTDDHKPKPLSLSNGTVYSTTPLTDKTLKHPYLVSKTIEMCRLQAGELFIGLDKNMQIEGRIIVYPEIISPQKFDLLQHQAPRQDARIGYLQLKRTTNGLRVTDDEGVFFLIDPKALKPFRWSELSWRPDNHPSGNCPPSKPQT